jgi:hypothetical protein
MILKLLLRYDGKITVIGRSINNKITEPYFIRVGLSKERYMKTLLRSYRLMKYTNVDIAELSLLSLKQWQRKEYPLPEGYIHKHGHSFNAKKLKQQNWNFRKKTAFDMINT